MKRSEQMFERKIHLWKTITLGVGEVTYLERVPFTYWTYFGLMSAS